MSANPPPLPPPPSQPAYSPPWEAPEPPNDERPSWRDGHAGWALVHLAIGVGVWIAGLFEGTYSELHPAQANNAKLEFPGFSGQR